MNPTSPTHPAPTLIPDILEQDKRRTPYVNTIGQWFVTTEHSWFDQSLGDRLPKQTIGLGILGFMAGSYHVAFNDNPVFHKEIPKLMKNNIRILTKYSGAGAAIGGSAAIFCDILQSVFPEDYSSAANILGTALGGSVIAKNIRHSVSAFTIFTLVGALLNLEPNVFGDRHPLQIHPDWSTDTGKSKPH